MKKQVLFIVMMLMPLMASAQTEIDGIYYNLNSTDKVAEVTCLYDVFDPIPSYRGEIVIPKTVVYGGVTYSVTSIGNSAFSDCSDLTSVIIPNSVTSIGSSAFYGCSSLTSVTIPNSVISIGNYAFSGCSGLTSVVIGNNVTSIGSSAFSGCSALTSIIIPNSVTTIGSVFDGCSSLERITFHCQEIGRGCLYEMKSIKEVIIGDEVKSIGDEAFYRCTGLNSVYITDLTAWCEIAFRHYSPMCPDGSCDASINNPLAYAQHLYLNGEEVKELVIPDGITSIGDYSFIGCNSLTSVNIPNSVKSIGRSAFMVVFRDL